LRPLVWLLVLILVSAGTGLGYRVWKQLGIRTATAINIDTGIESLEQIELNGSVQWIYIRGLDKANPILLNLHGGPGVTEMWAARSFGLEAEKHFTVVHWDQRGAGKSASEDYDLEDLTVDTYVNDTFALVNYLRVRFDQDKIYLVGHSWGTIPGLLVVRNHPELFHAYIGASQVVNLFEMETIGLRFARQQAETDSNFEALAAMEDISPPYLEDNLNDLGTQRRWLAYYGGSLRNVSIADGLHTLLTSPEYSLADIIAFFGMGTSAGHVWPQLANLDFFTQVPELEVPVYFFTGRYDYQTPFELTERYFDVLKAPHKELIWFESSAHIMKMSDPDHYQNMLIEKVLKGSDHHLISKPDANE
jgi:pimeloyl-ACP methyl ester carboxylesterase